MPYWQLFYHVVWTTKRREPLLTSQIEPVIYGFLRSKAIGLGGTLFALGGVEDHVHMVVAIPPSVAVANFVGQVKGVASTKFNKSGLSDVPFFWQQGYGVFSFDAKRLPNHVAYVDRQKEHHAEQRIIPVLERVGDDELDAIREPASIYRVEEADWWRDMRAWSTIAESSNS